MSLRGGREGRSICTDEKHEEAEEVSRRSGCARDEPFERATLRSQSQILSVEMSG